MEIYETDYLSPADVCALIPGLTVASLAQGMYPGLLPPRFLKPTPQTVLYRRSDVVEWIEASEQTSTRAE